MTTRTTNAPPGTQAVIRAIRVLKAFSPEHPELELQELADEVGLNVTTARRLLTALQSEGLVERDGTTNAYRLGPGAIVLGSRALRTRSLRRVARPEIERLAAETRETATIEIPFESHMLILDEVQGWYGLGAAAEVGTRWPLHATSTGKAFLAALPDAEVEELLEQPLTAFTPDTITEIDALLEELERIRERGFSTAIEEHEPNVVAAAAVITDWTKKVVGTISVTGPSSRLGPEEIDAIGHELEAAADRISHRLGYEDPTSEQEEP